MNIFLKCPHCGDTIAVNCAEQLELKSAACPKCQQVSLIRDFIPKCSLRVDGRNFQLHLGRQWVGRQVDGNTAEVQIPDDTRYMSKKHAIIELRCTNTGLECTFEEHGKNPTSIQGLELMEGDIIYLGKDTCLTLGGRSMYLTNEFE